MVFNVAVDPCGSYCIVNIPQLVVAKATECVEVVLIDSERIRKMELLTQKIEETDKRIKTLEEHFLDSKISLEEFRSMTDSLLGYSDQTDPTCPLETDPSKLLAKWGLFFVSYGV